MEPATAVDVIAQFQGLVGQRAAYPLVATILTFAIQIARKSPYTEKLWEKMPDGYRWLWPVVSGAVMGFVHGFQAGYTIWGALMETVFGIFGVSFAAMGLAATLKESPVKWDGGAGGAPPPSTP